MEATQTSVQLMLFAEASRDRAKTSQWQEGVQAFKASARAYGPSSPELLAKYDPDTSSWRTSQLCLDGAYQLFSETWPRSGLMRNGTAYQLPPLVRLTDATASGLWRTPQARDGDPRGQQSPEKRMAGGHSVSLAEQVMWPTQTARAWKDNASPAEFKRNEIPLAAQIGGSLNPTWVEGLMGFPSGWTDVLDGD